MKTIVSARVSHVCIIHSYEKDHMANAHFLNSRSKLLICIGNYLDYAILYRNIFIQIKFV